MRMSRLYRVAGDVVIRGLRRLHTAGRAAFQELSKNWGTPILGGAYRGMGLPLRPRLRTSHPPIGLQDSSIHTTLFQRLTAIHLAASRYVYICFVDSCRR